MAKSLRVRPLRDVELAVKDELRFLPPIFLPLPNVEAQAAKSCEKAGLTGGYRSIAAFEFNTPRLKPAAPPGKPPRVLELKDISLSIGDDDEQRFLLTETSVRIPRGHFAAIIGPSGCGKSTLLKVIAGIREHTLGSIRWDGRDLDVEGDLEPHEIGYVPQFSVAHEQLTVDECVESALRLRVGRLSGEELDSRIERVLKSTGLDEIADRRVALLSGGQRRRLAMAMELTSQPALLLCDEVTSGLDPKSEDEIVRLMHDLSRTEDRIVLSVTHSLQHVELYDSVVVLFEGHLVYHGAPNFIVHYFGIERPEELYPRLAQRKAADWHRSWVKHGPTYYQQSKLPALPAVKLDAAAAASTGSGVEDAPRFSEEEEIERLRKIVEAGGEKPAAAAPRPPAGEIVLPGFAAQLTVLLARRWKLFFRDRGQLVLQAALLLGFPFLVVIFAWDGLPDVKGLADSGSSIGAKFEQMKQDAATLKSISKTGGIVSGLIMFQVILLALTGSNNASREIAAERNLLEKEKFAGLLPAAYVASKVIFLGVLVLAQSLWMAFFVNAIVGFQGSFVEQCVNLVLVNAAITSVCLAISSWAHSAEQASLLGIYLVGFQLPLSGAVLALPALVAPVAQYFIASFWAWSGFIRSMENTRYYDAMTTTDVIPTIPAAGGLCIIVLAAHVLLGIIFAFTGSRNARWE